VPATGGPVFISTFLCSEHNRQKSEAVAWFMAGSGIVGDECMGEKDHAEVMVVVRL
jgi:hypothetical protein